MNVLFIIGWFYFYYDLFIFGRICNYGFIYVIYFDHEGCLCGVLWWIGDFLMIKCVLVVLMVGLFFVGCVNNDILLGDVYIVFEVK